MTKSQRSSSRKIIVRRSPMAQLLTAVSIIFVSSMHNGVLAQQANQQANLTDENPLVGWKDEPRERGTFTLLMNCCLTLFLCVWTALQVNIDPAPNEDPSQVFSSVTGVQSPVMNRLFASRVARKLSWSVITLVFPEYTLAMAMYERKVVQLLERAMQREDDPQAPRERWLKRLTSWMAPWPLKSDKNQAQAHILSDMSLRYFVVMGGFKVVEKREDNEVVEQREDNELVEKRADNEVVEEREDNTQHVTPTGGNRDQEQNLPPPPRTLTPHGVLFLVQQNAFHTQLTGASVRDRSKAGTVQKSIVLLQASWMVVQAVARGSQGLTISLLETHVLLHVMCSIVMYLAWWGKPVDLQLQEPIRVSSEILKQLQEAPRMPNKTNPFQRASNDGNEDPVEGQQDLPLAPKDEEEGSRRAVRTPPGPGSDYISDPYLIGRSAMGRLCFIQIWDAEFQWKNLKEQLPGAFRRVTDSRNTFRKEMVIVSMLGVTYGGMHLTTWNIEFPTVQEMWLWRASAIITAASSFLVFMIFYVLSVVLAFGQRKNKSWEPVVGWSGTIGFFVFGIPVILARLFLFVECFAALRHVPKNTYDVVKWAEAWPHLG